MWSQRPFFAVIGKGTRYGMLTKISCGDINSGCEGLKRIIPDSISYKAFTSTRKSLSGDSNETKENSEKSSCLVNEP